MEQHFMLDPQGQLTAGTVSEKQPSSFMLTAHLNKDVRLDALKLLNPFQRASKEVNITMDIEIRELERKDFSKVIDFAIEGMNFNRYVEGKTELRLYGRYFLYLELNRASQVLAAYMGKRLVGVLLADIKKEPKRYKSLWRNLYVKLVDAVMAIAYKKGTAPYDSANAAMHKKYIKRATPDGEICFLAADPSIQGKGIGTRLLNELAMREKGKLIYLYTDDNCTYQFYESKGFERSEEKMIEIELHGRTVPLTCLLYSKIL